MRYSNQSVQRIHRTQESIITHSARVDQVHQQIVRGGKRQYDECQRVNWLFALAFYFAIGCDHSANITKSANRFGPIKLSHGIWGIICLCVCFCNLSMNCLYFSTNHQRSANLLGEISRVSGLLQSSLKVLRCLKRRDATTRFKICSTRKRETALEKRQLNFIVQNNGGGSRQFVNRRTTALICKEHTQFKESKLLL